MVALSASLWSGSVVCPPCDPYGGPLEPLCYRDHQGLASDTPMLIHSEGGVHVLSEDTLGLSLVLGVFGPRSFRNSRA